MKLRSIISTVALLLFTLTATAQQKKDINTITKEEVLSMTIEELSAYELDEVMKMMDIAGASSIEELYELLLNKDVTSASKSEESLFDSPLSTTVLSYDEIVSSGATSIEEALRMVPGVIVREKTNGNYDVQIRGGQNMPMNNMLIYAENTTTLVMIDGRPVFNYGMGGILWESLPVSLGELDRIEVVRGPSSALYGPNAVNGVINLITKNITKKTPLVSANFQGGSQSTVIGDFRLSKKFSNKFSAGISTYYEYRDRNSDKIYANTLDEYMSLAEYAENDETYKWSHDNAGELFDDPRIAKEKIGINTNLAYKANGNLQFHLNAGYIDARANTSTIGDNPSPYNMRYGYGYFTNFIAEIYGLNIQASSNNVIQDFNKGHEGWIQDTEQYNFNIDYLFKFNKFSVRPGISYQSVYYDDRDYLTTVGNGYFNDRVALRNFSGSARFDFQPIERLRLVAALRAEKYNVPDKWMPSYQFIGSYKINENNLLRAVYSRANQSTFMINAYSDYTWDRHGLGVPEFIYFGGNDDPNLMTQDMIELGFRTRPSKRVLLDIEMFMNKAKDYSALMPDKTVTTTFTNPSPTHAFLPGEAYYTTIHMSHRALDMESKQLGISVSADVVFSEKLIMKAHATYQKTTIDNFMNASRNQVATYQSNDYYEQFYTDIMTFMANPTALPQPSYVSEVQMPESMCEDDVDNEAIPSFWGSLAFTYKPTPKLDITAQAYYYGSYFLYTQYETDGYRQYLAGNLDAANNPYARLRLQGLDVPDPEQKGKLDNTGDLDGKFLLNAKINYKINDNISVFVNGRNILNNESREYIFMDKIGGLYLAGFNFKF